MKNYVNKCQKNYDLSHLSHLAFIHSQLDIGLYTDILSGFE